MIIVFRNLDWDLFWGCWILAYDDFHHSGGEGSRNQGSILGGNAHGWVAGQGVFEDKGFRVLGFRVFTNYGFRF